MPKRNEEEKEPKNTESRELWLYGDAKKELTENSSDVREQEEKERDEEEGKDD